MIDLAAVLSSLKLAEFTYQKIKGKLSKQQKKEIVRQAERLVQAAGMDEIRRYDTAERKRIGGLTISAVAESPGRPPGAGGMASPDFSSTKPTCWWGYIESKNGER